MGETGKLEGNIDGMSSVLIDGKVIGNIMADTVCLRNQVNILSFHLCSLCLRGNVMYNAYTYMYIFNRPQFLVISPANR